MSNNLPQHDSEDSNPSRAFVHRLQQGDADALADAFSENRARLYRMIRFRMDPRLAGRVDPDDVLQEAYLDALSRLDHYMADPSRSLFVWLRLIVGQTLTDVHRRHLEAKMRAATREVSIHARMPQATSFSIAAELLADSTSPSSAVARDEVAQHLEKALEELSDIDREVLTLRHFEELTNSEVAELLEIQPKAASIRYIRALKRLKSILGQWPQFFGDGSS